MDTLVCRISAKVVAWVDIVFLCLFLLEIILMPAMVTAVAIIINDPEIIEDFDLEYGISDDEVGKANSIDLKYVLIMWAVATVFAVLVGFQLWAAVKLLRAAKRGLESAALGKARIWIYVTIVVSVLSIIGNVIFTIFIMNSSRTMTVIILRGTAFLVVYKFIKNVESITTTQSVELKNYPESAISEYCSKVKIVSEK